MKSQQPSYHFCANHMQTLKTLSLSVMLAGLTACGSTPAPIAEPVLEYEAFVECSTVIDLESTTTLPDDPKQLKRMMKNRTIILSQTMDENSACISTTNGKSSPYALFTIPTDITGAVVYAGSNIDANSMFAANIATLDANGQPTRTFEKQDFKKLGAKFGVQFSPKPKDIYVLIQADNAVIGNTEATSESLVGQYFVANQYGYGGYNTVATQGEFVRTFSYDGIVGLRVVFPKQDEK